MSGVRNIFSGPGPEGEITVQFLRRKFHRFLAVLELNHRALQMIGEMEEKSRGNVRVDSSEVRRWVETLGEVIKEISVNMIALGGESYHSLPAAVERIRTELSGMLSVSRPAVDEFVIPFSRLRGNQTERVGHKTGRLAEIKNHIGLPVPEGFAITAWAGHCFLTANRLEEQIHRRLQCLEYQDYEQLAAASDELQGLIRGSPVPEDLARAIQEGREELRARGGVDCYALRSSAIGEDSDLSFAGQYATLLNVPGDKLVDGYREILASKFNAKALYYFLSFAFLQSELPMSVGCLNMVDASRSGVVYTRDPVGRSAVVIVAIFGLGQLLMEGGMTPDEFRVSREDYRLLEKRLAKKTVRLALAPGGGVRREEVPGWEQGQASLSEAEIRKLVDYALRLERHYHGPQEIEWAIDKNGRLFLLQTRPLRIVEARSPVVISSYARTSLLCGGTTICPGAGCGPVFVVRGPMDLAAVPPQAVLVTDHPFPGLVAVLDKISALVTEVGGVASHVATLARERHLPALAGVEKARELPAGALVTVDATAGVIYEGSWPELVSERTFHQPSFADAPGVKLLKKALALIAPLHLLYSTDPNFQPENCLTYHDLTRFVHQKAMEEMFASAAKVELSEKGIGRRLRTDVPLEVHLIYLDREEPKGEEEWIGEDEVDSIPFRSFWEGVRKESRRPGVFATDRGFRPAMPTVLTKTSRGKFSQRSFAFLGREYMNLNLHMGYHFSLVEAMCAGDADKNYIRFQYKDGGATFDRRVRRGRLIAELLGRMGFAVSVQGDCLEAGLAYFDASAISDKLFLLGRLTMMTKQLDMALSNDAITQWYTEDYMKILGLQPRPAAGEPDRDADQ